MDISILINNQYYKENPSKILGVPYERSGRYGNITMYRGDVAQSLANIAQDCPVWTPRHANAPSLDHVEAAVPTTKQEQNIQKALKKVAKDLYDVQTAIDPNLDLISFEEVDAAYNKHLTEKQKQAFVWYMQFVLGRNMLGGWTAYHIPVAEHNMYINLWLTGGELCTDGNQLMPRFVFQSGNLYDRQQTLESNKEEIINRYSKVIYDKQLEALNQGMKAIERTYLRLDHEQPQQRLRVLLTDSIAKTYMISSLKDGLPFEGRKSRRERDRGRMDFANRSNDGIDIFEQLNLQTAFLWWLRNNTDTASVRYGLTWKDVKAFVVDNRGRKKSEEVKTFTRNKKNAKREAQRLFSQFLAQEILDEDRRAIERKWNQQYNGQAPMNYNQVPIGFSMARYYGGMDMDIRPEKREAVAAAMMTGSLCVAYGVGLGKTWCAIFTMAQFIENGWAARPLLSVPLQVYPQFVREIKGILPQLKVNELGNLSKPYLQELLDEDENIKMLPAKSISVITYQGFKQIGFSTNVEKTLLRTINDILDQDDEDQTARQQALQDEKIDGIIGKALAQTKVNVDELGIDFIAVDEAHAAKKVFTSVKAEMTDQGKQGRREYQIQGGEPSTMALKTFALCQYVQSLNKTGNVLLLSATPFTNSPLEVFSMLSLLAYNELKSIGLNNIKNFFDKFVLVSNELVIDAALNPVYKEIFTGFSNLVGLQKIIRKFFLYKQKTKGLKRPRKYVLPFKGQVNPDGALFEGKGASSVLPPSSEQRNMMVFVTNYAQGVVDDLPDQRVVYDPSTGKKSYKSAGRKIEDKETGVRLLMSVGMARALALSPYLFPFELEDNVLPTLNYKNYIHTSSKLQYTMNCIRSVKEAHEKKGEAVSGQIIYMNLGVEFFPLVKEYLVRELGFKAHEVGIIKGSMSKHEGKADIQDKFLGRRFNPKTQEYEPIPDEFRIKVLIGSNSITEGINLQTHCTVIYNLYLPWNPTDTIQLEGRGWRQGNIYKNIRIVYPLLEDSMDVFMFQKLDEKTKRINQIWNFDGHTAMLDLSDFNPSDLKYQIIKDPYRLAAIEAEELKTQLIEDADVVNSEYKLLGKLDSDANLIKSRLNDLWSRAVTWTEQRDKKEEMYEKYGAITDFLEKAQYIKRTLQARYRSKMNAHEQAKKKAREGGYYYWGFPPTHHYLYDGFLKALSRYNHANAEILQPRSLSTDPMAIKGYMQQLKERFESIKKEEENLESDQYLNARAEEIELERQSRAIERSTVDGRSREFQAMNKALLFDRRAELPKMNIAINTGNAQYKKDDKVTVLFHEQNKKATVLRTIFRNQQLSPMYRVQFAFGGGFRELVMQEEIIPKASKATSAKAKKRKRIAIAQAQRIRLLELEYQYKQTA